MNTPHRFRLVRRAGLAAGPALLSVLSCLAATPAPDAVSPPAPKTHVLFVGAEIDLQKGDKFHRIVDVTRAHIVARDGEKPIEVRIAPDLALRVTESIKISEASLAISELKAERAYTLGNDPFASLVQASVLASDSVVIQDLAAREMRSSESRAGYAQAQAQTIGGPEQAAQWAQIAKAEQQNLATAQQTYSAAAQAGTSLRGAGDSLMNRRAGQELYDAIRVSFEIGSEIDLPHPYLALIARIREPTSEPGQIRKWVYVKALRELSAGEKTTVKIYQPGLPPGFILEGCEVHIYDGREEFATNLSRRRIEVNDDEAHQFRILSYLTANQGRTLAPALVTKRLAPDAQSRLPAARLDETIYVRVSKTGKITATFRDAAAKEPLQDPQLDAALAGLRFNPALDAGKPVEGIAPVTPRALTTL